METSPVPPSQRPSLIVTAYLVGLALSLAVAWLVQLLLVLPAYEARFVDLRLRLPFMTELMIGAARFVVRHWLVAIPGLLSFFVVAGLVSYLIRHHVQNRFCSIAWFAVLIGLPAAANVAFWIALLTPLRDLGFNK
jgi:type II secretory pathway component PulF